MTSKVTRVHTVTAQDQASARRHTECIGLVRSNNTQSAQD